MQEKITSVRKDNNNIEEGKSCDEDNKIPFKTIKAPF
jgi:hypothetical protein